MNAKITGEHLSRKAYVYVRQSSMDQVRNNRESRRRQYGLADKARSMGWSEVEVIDEDQGRSGASAAERTGFQRLVAEVGLGRCGAVVSLEVSRLARNNADWYRLLDLCSLAKTLLIDSEAVYDPRLTNDRLLLGLKGAVSEAELGLIHQRAQQGILSKAKRGELFTTVAVGYVKTREDRLEKDPDLRIRESIQGVFDKFIETGSARQTLLWYRQEKIRLPARRHGRWGWEVLWKLPVYNTILKLLKNPVYAGAYVWGRTGTVTEIEQGRARKQAGKEKPLEEWTILIRDHHEGYIDWLRYERNQNTLRQNAAMKGSMARGAPRSGRSLIAGLLHCGHCGRRLHVAYGGVSGCVPRYSCQGALINHGGRRCISFGGLKVDQAVEREILRVVSPAAVEAAPAAAREARDEMAHKRRLLERELEQMRYEAERAWRQYNAVDPANRLVADSLEKRWESALQRVRTTEARLQELAASAEEEKLPERDSLLRLAESFPEVWSSPEADMKIKKRIARLLIEEIVASVDENRRLVRMVIRWKGGKHTRLQVMKNKTGVHRFRTEKDVVGLVRQLATQVRDSDIARILNRLGKKTGRGNSWTEARVRSMRSCHKIPVYRAEGAGEYFNMKQAAAVLGISPMSVRRLIQSKILPAEQVVPMAPWRIRCPDLDSEQVQKAVKAVKTRSRLPLPSEPSQLKLLEPTT